MSKTRRLVLAAVLTAAALALSYIESFIPVPFPVPGAKLGLANLIILFALYEVGVKEALAIDLARVFISGFLFGTMSSILFSLSGALVSFIGMALLVKYSSFTPLLVSVAGGILHNAGQLAAACFVLATPKLIISYGPFLFLLGTLTGMFTGLICRMLIKRLTPVLQQYIKKSTADTLR